MTNEYERRQRERSEWLASLSPTQDVFIPGRWSAGQITSVARITATQIVLVDGGRFRRDSGQAIGRADKWSVPSIQPVTQEVKDAIEKQGLGVWLDRVHGARKELSLEVLRAMKAAHDAHKAEEK